MELEDLVRRLDGCGSHHGSVLLSLRQAVRLAWAGAVPPDRQCRRSRYDVGRLDGPIVHVGPVGRHLPPSRDRPGSLVPAVMGRTSIWFAAGTATSLLTFIVLGVLFDLALPWPDTIFVVPLVILTCASTYCLTLFLGCLVTRQPRIRNLVLGLWNTGVKAFCGVVVPISFWPDSVQTIVRFVPITHGLQAIRLLLDEASATAILSEAALEVAVGVIWVAIAIIVMDRMANAGRKDGSIEFLE